MTRDAPMAGGEVAVRAEPGAVTNSTTEKHVFLSYARKDLGLARSLVQALEAEGIRVWWDQAIEESSYFREGTETALASAAAVLVLWTPASIRSSWVISEAVIGRDTGRFVPLCLDCIPPIGFRQFQFIQVAVQDGSVDRGFVSRLSVLLDDSFINGRPRLRERRGFVVVDFASRYRLGALKSASTALGIQTGFYLLGSAASGFEGWRSANGGIPFPEQTPWAFIFSWICLWIGRTLMPDSMGLARSTREHFFERRPVKVWLGCLTLLLVPALVLLGLNAMNGQVDGKAALATILWAPFGAGLLLIVPSLALLLLNQLGYIDRHEKISKVPKGIDDGAQLPR